MYYQEAIFLNYWTQELKCMLSMHVIYLSPSFDTVKQGDRIAQLICEKIYMPELEECGVCSDLHHGIWVFPMPP